MQSIKRFWLVTVLAMIGTHPAAGYQMAPQVISGNPVSPYVKDKRGTGFCASSRQAKAYRATIPDFGKVDYDAGNVLGSESSTVPKACYSSNLPQKGVYLPRFINCFFDGGFFPSQVGGKITNAKFPRQLRNGTEFVTVPFDFSVDSDPADPNGDFSRNNQGSIEKGSFFPVELNTDGKTYDASLLPPENRYRDTYWLRIFQETRNDDVIRDTATRFRAFLNVPPDWVNRQVVLGAYGDDALSVSLYDANRNQYIIISASSNRCEPCLQKGDACKTPDPTDPNQNNPRPKVCKSTQVCLRNSDCEGSGLGTCDLSTHSCTKELTCKSDLDCGSTIFGTCDRILAVCKNKLWCQPCDLTKTGMRWRVTNHVLFTKPGLYPIEVLHIQNSGNAALELSYRLLDPSETFEDIYDSFGHPLDEDQKIWTTYAANAHSSPLSKLGFTLLDSSMLFQTVTGDPLDCDVYGQCSIQDISQCQDIRFRNPKIDSVALGCNAGTFCNPAGLCQPCTTNDACGEGICQKCVGSSACFQVNGHYQCAECGSSADCSLGQDCQNGQCVCKNDADCPKGQTCNAGQCEPCSSNNACAGNSCSCCAGIANQCVQTDPNDPNSFACAECKVTKDCNPNRDPNNQKVCDPVNHRCIDKIPSCNTDDRCGESCSTCPKDKPHCLNGNVCVQCRTDMECGNNQYCLSGTCVACNSDKKCGQLCKACSSQTPFCLDPGDGKESVCVGCFKDEQCGIGGTCDIVTHQCTNPCTISCPKDKICQSNRCIQCLSSAQCPCGQSCDVSTGTCLGGCQDTSDCLSDECCSKETNQCFAGHCSKDATIRGGALCCNLTQGPESLGSFSSETKPSLGLLFVGISLAALSLATLFFLRPRKKKKKAQA